MHTGQTRSDLKVLIGCQHEVSRSFVMMVKLAFPERKIAVFESNYLDELWNYAREEEFDIAFLHLNTILFGGWTNSSYEIRLEKILALGAFLKGNSQIPVLAFNTLGVPDSHRNLLEKSCHHLYQLPVDLAEVRTAIQQLLTGDGKMALGDSLAAKVVTSSIEKIKIPSIQPGTPCALRKCSVCNTPINIPLNLFNRILECPSCHNGILFKRRIDQLKETGGCLGGCLLSLLGLGVWILFSIYSERPPWRYGWSPVVKSPKVEESTTQTITHELPSRFKGDQFYYLGEFYQNAAYLLKFENGRFLVRLPGDRCQACVLGVRETFMVVYYERKTQRFAFDLDNPTFKRGRTGQLQFAPVLPDSLAAKAIERASNPATSGTDIKQGRRSRWILVETHVSEKQGEAYYVESLMHFDAESGCEYFQLLTVTEDRVVLTIDGTFHKFHAQFSDVFGTSVGEMEERPMKNGDVASRIWRLHKDRVIE